jgi:hypothetical protein
MKYTVILRRDLAACDLLEIEFDTEAAYIAQIETETSSLREVIKLAKKEVFERDKEDAASMGNADHDHDTSWYQLVCVLEGHPKVLVYDFQAKEF